MSQTNLEFDEDHERKGNSECAYYPSSVVDASWREVIDTFFQRPSGRDLMTFLKSEIETDQTIFPPADSVYRAFESFPVADTRVVILGQDPYHGKGQAHGLSFSVRDGIKLPPSLKNIYKELNDDLAVQRSTGDLSDWAEQGVLLLNTALTVRQSSAGSHSRKGWLELTDSIIQLVSDQAEPCVFILWGNDAIAKESLVDSKRHCVLTSVHPSPLSAYRGFWGSKPFSKANEFLKSQGREPIEW